nr:NAP1-related protein 2-like [Nicotiana tomentosiformis]
MMNMAEEVNFVIKTMVQLLGVNKEVALLQFELLLKSLHIRKDYILLILKALKKEYVSEEEEYEVLKKIWDVKMEHVQLIRDEHFNLIKMGEEKGNKKQKMAEKAEDEENNNFDGKQLVPCIEKLQDIQDKLEKINEEARDEVLKIAQKLSQIRKPVYEKRNHIIKSIPDFWLTAFLRHPILSELVSTEEDHKIFEFLCSIEVEDTEDFKSGYTITFYFSPNPFFENTMLSKTYTFLEDGRPRKVTASTVQWKEGNGVVPHAEEGFFRWFSSEVDQKYNEVAAIIKDELWPNPLNYFNEADEEKDFHEADKGGDKIVNDSEDDGNEEADEADEEDLEAAGGSGNEVVKDNEDYDEEADEEDLEAADEAGDEGT